jgi:hypothetical protein
MISKQQRNRTSSWTSSRSIKTTKQRHLQILLCHLHPQVLVSSHSCAAFLRPDCFLPPLQCLGFANLHQSIQNLHCGAGRSCRCWKARSIESERWQAVVESLSPWTWPEKLRYWSPSRARGRDSRTRTRNERLVIDPLLYLFSRVHLYPPRSSPRAPTREYC